MNINFNENSDENSNDQRRELENDKHHDGGMEF